jgi:hypothetical protein
VKSLIHGNSAIQTEIILSLQTCFYLLCVKYYFATGKIQKKLADFHVLGLFLANYDMNFHSSAIVVRQNLCHANNLLLKSHNSEILAQEVFQVNLMHLIPRILLTNFRFSMQIPYNIS